MKRKWTEAAIQQAFDEFIQKHDRLPTREEMYKKHAKKFPRPKSVKVTTGITMGDYLKLNYSNYLHRCQSRLYGRQTKEYWIEDFKCQYIKHNHPTKSKYNKLRRQGTPNSETLAKIAGVLDWDELLSCCGFQKEKKVELKGEVLFEPTLENLQKLNKKLQEILKPY